MQPARSSQRKAACSQRKAASAKRPGVALRAQRHMGAARPQPRVPGRSTLLRTCVACCPRVLCDVSPLRCGATRGALESNEYRLRHPVGLGANATSPHRTLGNAQREGALPAISAAPKLGGIRAMPPTFDASQRLRPPGSAHLQAHSRPEGTESPKFAPKPRPIERMPPSCGASPGEVGAGDRTRLYVGSACRPNESLRRACYVGRACRPNESLRRACYVGRACRPNESLRRACA